MKQNSASAAPRKILVIKLCCLGDAIFITPALRALRQSFSEAEITFLGSSWIKPILEQIRFIDHILLFDAPNSPASRSQKARLTLKLILQLRSQKFDAVIICHRSPVFSLLGLLAGIRTRLGFTSKANTLLLTHTVEFKPGEHEILRYAELVEALGAKFEDTATELTPSAADIESIRKTLRQKGIEANEKIIGIFPGGGENPGTVMTIKRWEAEKWSQLCQKILQEFDAHVVLLGGPSDLALNDKVAAAVQAATGDAVASRLTNIAGLTTLRELPALLAACTMAAGGDTGPMHIAAAVGTRTLLLFGPSDPRLVAPLQSTARYLWKQVECSPCYTPERVMDKNNFVGNVFGCHTGTHACLKTLTVVEVFDALRPWLEDPEGTGDVRITSG